MDTYQMIAQFLNSLNARQKEDITVPDSIRLDMEGNALVASVHYDVDYGMLKKIIENFKRWFIKTWNADQSPKYDASPHEHSFVWPDGMKVYVRTQMKERDIL